MRHHSCFNPFKDWYTFHWIWKFIKTSIFTTHTMVAVRSEEMFKFHLMLSLPPTYCCQRDKEKRANPLKAKSLNLSGLMKKMREFTCENPQIVCAWWGKTSSSSFSIFCPLFLLGSKTFSCCCFKLFFPFKVQSFLCWCLLALFP